jgi:oligopeptide transport system substrate-binding protein
VLHGKLRAIEEMTDATAETPQRVYVVDVDGRERRFSTIGASGAEKCRQVLLDFSEVGIQVVDERTLRITLENPTPFFLNLTGFYPLSPVNRRCLETHGRQWVKPENLVTNGPYRLQFRRIRDRLRLVKNEHYWNRKKVRLETIDALAVESPVTGLNLYMTGQADWIPTVPPSTVAPLLAEKRDDFKPTPEFTTYFYRLNITKPPLDDARVRRALALALDKREIVETVTQAGEVVARSLVPTGLKNYDPPQLLEHDAKKARKLLAEAGFPSGQGIPTITILYNNDESHKSIAELIQDQWRRNLGIATQLEALEWGSFLSRQHQLKFTICRAGWTGDYMDANTFLDMFVTDGANNQTGWSNAEYDRLIARAASKEVSAAERKKILEQAETLLLTEMPVIPIYFKVSKNMVRPYVKGFFPNVRDMHPLNNLWVDQDAKREALSRIGR